MRTTTRNTAAAAGPDDVSGHQARFGNKLSKKPSNLFRPGRT